MICMIVFRVANHNLHINKWHPVYTFDFSWLAYHKPRLSVFCIFFAHLETYHRSFLFDRVNELNTYEIRHLLVGSTIRIRACIL